MNRYDIPYNLIEKMIDIGKIEDFACISTAMTPSEIKHYSQATRQLPAFWKGIAAPLAEEELVALIKAMTMAENILPGWSSGSVSPVIWLFNCYRPADQKAREELTDWILARTQNPWVPFTNHGARSLAEYQEIKERIRTGKMAVQAAETIRQVDASTRRASKATRDIFNALRRGDVKAVKALMTKGADLHAVDEIGRSVLDRAREHSNEEIIQLIDEKLKRAECL